MNYFKEKQTKFSSWCSEVNKPFPSLIHSVSIKLNSSSKANSNCIIINMDSYITGWSHQKDHQCITGKEIGRDWSLEERQYLENNLLKTSAQNYTEPPMKNVEGEMVWNSNREFHKVYVCGDNNSMSNPVKSLWYITWLTSKLLITALNIYLLLDNVLEELPHGNSLLDKLVENPNLSWLNFARENLLRESFPDTTQRRACITANSNS